MCRLRFFAAMLWLCSLSCAPQNYLTVIVENLPADTRSVLVLVASNGQPARALDPLNLDSDAAKPAHFVLSLPPSVEGGLQFTVGAFREENGTGCLLAAASKEPKLFIGPREETFITLIPIKDTACHGKSPLLLDVQPTLAKTEGGESVELKGFGFQPGAKFLIGEKLAEVIQEHDQPHSFQVVRVRIPSYAGFGPVRVTVLNPDDTQDVRDDLLNLYSPVLTLGSSTTNIADGCSLLSIGDLVGARFLPQTAAGFAASRSNKNDVKVTHIYPTTLVISSPPETAVEAQPTGLVTGDFDRDGDIDLVVANTGSQSIQLLRNEGTEVLAPGSPLRLATSPGMLATADLDGDGYLDIVAANASGAPNGLTILLNNRLGGFDIAQSVALSGQPVSIGALPIDTADQFPEIFVAFNSLTYAIVLLNKPTASLRFETGGTNDLTIPLGEAVSKLLVQDLDGDSYPDVVGAVASKASILLMKNDGLGNLAPSELLLSAIAGDIALADMNGDGLADLIVTKPSENQIQVFLNQPGGGFDPLRSVPFDLAAQECDRPQRIVSLDLNGDGKNDILYNGTTKTIGGECMTQRGCIYGIPNLSM